MSLYETLFSQYDVATSQILVTNFDFEYPDRRRNLQVCFDQLYSLDIWPKHVYSVLRITVRSELFVVAWNRAAHQRERRSEHQSGNVHIALE